MCFHNMTCKLAVTLHCYGCVGGAGSAWGAVGGGSDVALAATVLSL